MKKQDEKKLRLWQERLSTNEAAYEDEENRMAQREALYMGSHTIAPIVAKDKKSETPHVRNICAELIEAQVDSNIPAPKVTARRKEDELKAKLIEDMLRNELDRMPFEQLNDMMERTVPIQGGAAFLLEWDNTQRTHTTVGELTVRVLHPRKIVPQDGVYTGIEDMDYVILKMPQTKEYIKRRYGVDVSDEGEEDPEIKGDDGSPSDDMVTQYLAYYRNKNGGIGLFSWVTDYVLIHLEDYQARRLKKCATCGAMEPAEDLESMDAPTLDGTPPGGEGTMTRNGRKACPYCGGTKWESAEQDSEALPNPVLRSDGSTIGGMVERVTLDETMVDAMGLPIPVTVQEPMRVPYYKPDIYPVILQKNVSVYGKFLGDSDIDKIADQQNSTNRLEAKILDKLLKSGSFVTLPPAAHIDNNAEDMKTLRTDSPGDQAMIGVYTLQGDVEQDLVYLSQIYEEARQVIGITDSFQGRADRTATSGKAKEFAAAQSAGRLESKRVMKNAAYAALFEAMFKFKLAYCDEPRPVTAHDDQGNPVYEEFNKWDFLEQDEAGEWYWNDQFLFSTDDTAPLANNREAMWQEARMNLQTGAFGDPSQLQTLILFWSQMETLHYPMAAEAKQYLEQQLQQQQAAQQAQMMQMQAAQQEQMGQAAAGLSQGTVNAVVQQARAKAAQDVMAGAGKQQ